MIGFLGPSTQYGHDWYPKNPHTILQMNLALVLRLDCPGWTQWQIIISKVPILATLETLWHAAYRSNRPGLLRQNLVIFWTGGLSIRWTDPMVFLAPRPEPGEDFGPLLSVVPRPFYVARGETHRSKANWILLQIRYFNLNFCLGIMSNTRVKVQK